MRFHSTLGTTGATPVARVRARKVVVPPDYERNFFAASSDEELLRRLVSKEGLIAALTAAEHDQWQKICASKHTSAETRGVNPQHRVTWFPDRLASLAVRDDNRAVREI